MRALIVVDVQNDFCPGGALPVPHGDEVVPVINEIIESGKYDLVVFTKDWHAAESEHFKKWPPHCVARTPGADLHEDLRVGIPGAHLVLKGNGEGDGYSAFENPALMPLLDAHEIAVVDVVGLATDYCVRATALDAAGSFIVNVVLSACRGVSHETTVAALDEMSAAGVWIAWRLP